MPEQHNAQRTVVMHFGQQRHTPTPTKLSCQSKFIVCAHMQTCQHTNKATHSSTSLDKLLTLQVKGYVKGAPRACHTWRSAARPNVGISSKPPQNDTSARLNNQRTHDQQNDSTLTYQIVLTCAASAPLSPHLPHRTSSTEQLVARLSLQGCAWALLSQAAPAAHCKLG